MTDEAQKRRKRRRLWFALAMVVLILAAVFVPPMISISRYKNRIAELVSHSLGRPVRLSGVELRLLPWPSFVLSNLVVEENPAYGAEPVLHAETVTTDFRLLALWRGRLEISRISVDNASLNVVHMPGGGWNLDPLFRTAAAKAGAVATKEAQDRRAPRLPYLEATESRINFKNGVEKLPFSIVNADLSFWEESPGDWHIRLRGQPARTDVSLFQEDTGVVRIDASLHSAPALRDMPLRVDLEWSEAQLGQLSRLLIGSDPGWRGNLTADLHLDGTPETAHVTARLQAAGVHRAEFAPAEPLDFDANCAFNYHYSSRAIQNIACDSPLGNGRVRLAGDLPGSGAQPDLTVALDHMPVAAALGFLRTVRSGIDPNLTASGTISGKMTYSGRPIAAAPRTFSRRRHNQDLGRPAGPLTGSFTVSGFQLSGGVLNNSISAHHVVLEPETTTPNQPLALTGTADIAAGGLAPLVFTPRLTVHGYELSVRGQANLANARQFAQLAGAADVTELDALSGGPISVALDAQGSWLPPQPAELSPPQPTAPNQPLASASLDPVQPAKDSADNLSGTITLHDATWKPDYLARSVAISQAVLQLDGDEARWDPIDFSYGPVKAVASLTLPTACGADQLCAAHFDLQFGSLDAGELQSAILGARPHTSLFEDLIDRLHLSSAPAWPALDGTVKAASLKLGPVTLDKPTAALKIDSTGARITSLDARMLGGKFRASGTFTRPDTDQGRPTYAFDARFTDLSAAAVGKLLGMRFAGGPLEAEGKIEVSGVTPGELAESAKGTLHFGWRRGAVKSTAARMPAIGSKPERVPTALARFTSLTGDAEIADGKITFRHCEAMHDARRRTVSAEVTLGNPVRVTFAAGTQAVVATRPKARR
jgi:AsmA family